MIDAQAIDAKIKELGGNLKVNDVAGSVATFYHASLSQADIEALSAVEGINGVAFYVSDITKEDLERLSVNRSIKKIGIFSCKNISDDVFDVLKLFPNLESVALIDAAISKSALEEYKVAYPSVKISEPKNLS